MATERLSMRQIREILRQKWCLGQSHRAVAESLGIGSGTVGTTVLRARAAGLDWGQVERLTDEVLEARVYGPPTPPTHHRVVPDCAYLHAERRKPGVTLELLHLEYLEQHPDGYRYTQFCEFYRRWCKRRGLSMRQVHRAGEKCFVDYAGTQPSIIDAATGEVIPVQLFVAVLGASNYTYVEATRTQQVPDWIASHQRAFQYFGGVTTALVPDQLKSGVTIPCCYEPGLQKTYEEFARFAGTVVLPARPGKPRDKAQASYCSSLLSTRCTLRKASAVTEAFAGMGVRKWTRRRFEEEAPVVVGTHRSEHALPREAIGRGVMHTELGGDFGGREPSRPVEMLRHARDSVSRADVAHPEPGERLPSSRPEPPSVQGVGDLAIRLLRRQRPHHFDDRGRRPPEIWRASGARAFEGGRRPAFPANVQLKRVSAEQRDILDQEPQDALALPRWRPRIVPHARQIGDEALNSFAIVAMELGPVRLRRACVLILERRQSGELLIPLLLERIGDQPVFGPDEHELALGELGFFASPLDLRPVEAIDLGLAPAEFIEYLQGDIERSRRHRLENELAHGRVQGSAGDDLARRRGGRDAPAAADVL
jgi:transposase